MTESPDPFAWIREVRHRISAEFNHDPRRYCEYLREREKRHPERMYRSANSETPPSNDESQTSTMTESPETVSHLRAEARKLSLHDRLELIRQLASDAVDDYATVSDDAEVGLFRSFEGAATLMQCLEDSADKHP